MERLPKSAPKKVTNLLRDVILTVKIFEEEVPLKVVAQDANMSQAWVKKVTRKIQ